MSHIILTLEPTQQNMSSFETFDTFETFVSRLNVNHHFSQKNYISVMMGGFNVTMEPHNVCKVIRAPLDKRGQRMAPLWRSVLVSYLPNGPLQYGDIGRMSEEGRW